MKLDKVFAIAAREYAAAVKTKAFVISVLLLPIMFGLIFAIEAATARLADDRVRTFAVVDRIGTIFDGLRDAVDIHNRQGSHWKLERVESTPASDVDLSNRVRSGNLAGYLTIDPRQIVLHAIGIGDVAFRAFADRKINELLRNNRLKNAGFNPTTVGPLLVPIPFSQGALARIDPRTGQANFEEPPNELASIGVPLGLAIIMFMIVIVSAIPMMQGVIEEKQLRIAEVLLASVQPFELMSGKLIGMFAVSATLVAIYGGGGLLAGLLAGSSRLHLIGQYVSPATLAWFVAFQILAVMMFGSMYIAIGASCSDMREAQALLLPLNLLIMLPLLLLETVLEHPSGTVARWASFFPTAAPFLTIVRIATPPGISLWEAVVPMVIVVLTTITFVWAGGRIFRVGMMSGGTPDWRSLFRWMIRG